MARRKMFSDIEKGKIIEYYKKGNSLIEVGNMFNITIGAVHYILKKSNIDRRTLSVANSLKWTDERRKAQSDIRKCNPSTTLGKTWKVDKVVKRPNQTGEKNHFWKGGKTKLSSKIRNSVEYKIWRKQIFERDSYTCQICNRRNKKGDKVIIDADHIYPFSKILDDFNITSIEEAVSCEKLWDIENGRTLCRECHKKTDTYGVNLTKNA